MVDFDIKGTYYRIFSEIVDKNSSICVVCFDNWRQPQSLNSTPFAQNFLRGRGINGVYILTASNDWYLNSEIFSLIRECAARLRKFSYLAIYGSSMGGYAALRFSHLFQTQTVVAISPQYSINRLKVHFEKRWAAEAEMLSFEHEQDSFCIKSRKTYIVSDNICYGYMQDFKHVIMYRHHGNFEHVPVPFSGHPSQNHLGIIGAVGQFSLGLLMGDEKAILQSRQMIKRRRMESHVYWTNRGRALLLRDPAGSVHCLRKARELGAESTLINHLLETIPPILNHPK